MGPGQFILLLLSAYILSAESIRFYIRSNQRKCLTEEIRHQQLVLGEYEIQDNGQRADVVVKDLKGEILFTKENAVKGRFSFATENYDQYEICFITKATGGVAAEREVFLSVRHGSEAKNYEDIAKAEHLKPLEVELKKLEDLALGIVEDFSYMRHREAEMRNTNESTQSRLMYLGVFSMLCLFVLAIWQVLYLRRYFKAKKLIE